jgi:amidophosphoribosyltransferase
MAKVEDGVKALPRDLDDDRLREECGVFGIFDHQDAATITALGLHALQHRGQEAAGIVTYDGKHFIREAARARGRLHSA